MSFDERKFWGGETKCGPGCDSTFFRSLVGTHFGYRARFFSVFFLLSIINYRLGQRWVAPAGLFGFSRPANLMSLGSFVSKRAKQYWLVSDENLEIRDCRSWTRSISNWMNTWTKEHWWGALRCARLTRTSIKANHYPGSWKLLTKNSGPINNSIPWIPNLGDFTWQQVCALTLLDIDSIACRQWF